MTHTIFVLSVLLVLKMGKFEMSEWYIIAIIAAVFSDFLGVYL